MQTEFVVIMRSIQLILIVNPQSYNHPISNFFANKISCFSLLIKFDFINYNLYDRISYNLSLLSLNDAHANI